MFFVKQALDTARFMFVNNFITYIYDFQSIGLFSVPPENITVTKSVIDVIENEPPEIVRCSGSGRPKLNYIWKNATMPEITKGDILQLPVMTRAAATGPYICEAWNKYNNQTMNVYFNVLCKFL